MLWAREVTRVANNQRGAFGVYLIMATHRDLLAEVQAGRFRENLCPRLLGLSIALPPLRQRSNGAAAGRSICAGLLHPE